MYLISYDISSDRLRSKVAKELQNYGRRVQYSVFECRVSRGQYQELYGKLCRLTANMEDGSIRFYELCENCEKKLRLIGEPSVQDGQEDDGVIVI